MHNLFKKDNNRCFLLCDGYNPENPETHKNTLVYKSVDEVRRCSEKKLEDKFKAFTLMHDIENFMSYDYYRKTWYKLVMWFENKKKQEMAKELWSKAIKGELKMDDLFRNTVDEDSNSTMKGKRKSKKKKKTKEELEEEEKKKRDAEAAKKEQHNKERDKRHRILEEKKETEEKKEDVSQDVKNANKEALETSNENTFYKATTLNLCSEKWLYSEMLKPDKDDDDMEIITPEKTTEKYIVYDVPPDGQCAIHIYFLASQLYFTLFKMSFIFVDFPFKTVNKPIVGGSPGLSNLELFSKTVTISF